MINMINMIKDLLRQYKTVELICINKEDFIANSSLNIDILEKRIIVGFIDEEDTVITTFGDYITPYEIQFFKIKEYSNVDDELLDTLIRKAVRLELIEQFNLPVDIIVNDNEEYKSFFDERYQSYLDKINY